MLNPFAGVVVTLAIPFAALLPQVPSIVAFASFVGIPGVGFVMFPSPGFGSFVSIFAPG